MRTTTEPRVPSSKAFKSELLWTFHPAMMSTVAGIPPLVLGPTVELPGEAGLAAVVVVEVALAVEVVVTRVSQRLPVKRASQWHLASSPSLEQLERCWQGKLSQGLSWKSHSTLGNVS
jgi:hypothetical protein